MQVFKLFFKIARSKIGIGIVYLVVFLAICFPMVHSTQEKLDFTDTSLALYVRDEDHTEASARLIETLAKKNEIVELENDKTKILDAMYYEIVDYALVIPEGYQDHLSHMDEESMSHELFQSYHMRDSYAVAMMNLDLNEYVRNVRMKIAQGLSLSDALTEVEKSMEQGVEVKFYVNEEKTFVDENYTQDFAVFFQMLPYVLIAVIVNVLSPILLTLNRKEPRERIECSRVSIASYVRQIFSGSAILTVVIWLVFMLGGMVLYGGIYKGTSCWMAVLNSFIFAMFAAIFAIFIVSFNVGTTVVGMISQIFGLGMAFISGCFMPQSMLGNGILTIAKFLPAYWYIKANDILSGAQMGTMKDVWVCFAVEMGFVVVLLIATIIKRSRK
ncbi:MAG: ABC transporter permease [Anaerolineaceae bacterium]|nr:ABC transporter permease [Anaerolineaceae bacterium]